jgi:excisionase family DNA binding protein
MTDVITSAECAELLRCTPEHAEELARSGDLPATKIGRNWLFVRADLLAYLAERAREEAQQRRSRRQPGVSAIISTAKPRRRVAPVLPTA